MWTVITPRSGVCLVDFATFVALVKGGSEVYGLLWDFVGGIGRLTTAGGGSGVSFGGALCFVHCITIATDITSKLVDEYHEQYRGLSSTTRPGVFVEL